ncbi:MAG TPA: trigger factor [Ktedonobacterales bacterium]|nr:trigger factor [Ktedonobacterales bacterium]
MKITVEKTPQSEAVLDVELDWDEVEKASDRAYRKLAQKYTVPGFRRGHAPRTMLERMIGKDAIYQEGLDDLINQSYKQAVSEHQLTPIGQADVDAEPMEPGQPYRFKATVPILSPVQLGAYHSLHFDKPDVSVSDEDVEKVLADYQNQQAIWAPVERPAKIGDHVTVNLLLKVEDRTVSDLKDNEFELTSERPGLFAGMDAHVEGMTEGETREFTTTIAEDYANQDIAGKEAQYTVTLKAVKEKDLPPLDDELAKTAGKYETLDDLRKAIRADLLQRRTTQAQRDLEAKVMEAATEQASVELHHLLIEEEADSLYHQMEHLLQQQQMSMDQFLMLSQKTAEEYKKELEPEAEKNAKTDLVLEAIADQEELTVSDRELQSLLDLYARLGATKSQRVNQLSATARRRLEASIKREKARNFLIEHATRPQTETEEASATATEASAETDAESPAQAAEESGASI